MMKSFVKKSVAIFAAASVLTAGMSTVWASSLSEGTPEGETEVKAAIPESADPGAVSYVIRIPSSADFGNLQQPSTDTDSNKDIAYVVAAVQINNLEDTKRICVSVKDADSTNGLFYVRNQGKGKNLQYDLYEGSPDTLSGPVSNRGQADPTTGYPIAYFQKTGNSITGILRLNQRQLFGVDLTDYTGDYTGRLAFYSEVVDNPTHG